MKKCARDYVGEDEQEFGEQRRDNQGFRNPVGHAQCDAMSVRRGDTFISPRLRTAFRGGHLKEQ